MKRYSLKRILLEETEASADPEAQAAAARTATLKSLLASLPAPAKDPAGEDYTVGGTSKGYAWEQVIRKGINDAKNAVVGQGPGGVVGMEPKTFKPYKSQAAITRYGRPGTTGKTDKYDISLEVHSDGNEVMVNDGQATTRFATLEIKLIPARFGQLKKELFTKLEWDGSKVDYTIDTGKLPDASDQAWLKGVMADVNSSSSKSWFSSLLAEMNRLMKNLHTNEHMQANGCLPLVGNLDSFDFTQSMYRQLGQAYTFDSKQGPTMGGEPVGEELAKLSVKGASFSFQGETVTFPDGIPTAPEGIMNNVPIDGDEWIKYMSKTKDLLVAGRNTPQKNPNPPGCTGSIFALNPTFVSRGFPLFSFPSQLNLTCRMDASSGMWRMETDGAQSVPAGGIPFTDEIELYETLIKAHPSHQSDIDAVKDELGEMYIDNFSGSVTNVDPDDPENRTSRPKFPIDPLTPEDEVGRPPEGSKGKNWFNRSKRSPLNPDNRKPAGRFKGLKRDKDGNLTGEEIIEKRKHKYSITAKLLGKK